MRCDTEAGRRVRRESLIQEYTRGEGRAKNPVCREAEPESSRARWRGSYNGRTSGARRSWPVDLVSQYSLTFVRPIR
jgi:hypothetical protein